MAITVILIAGLLFMLKFFKVKIMEPAGIYSTVWLFFIIGSILFLRGEYEFKYSGIIWILITCYLFIIISRLVSSKEKCLVYRTIQRPYIPWKILLFIVIMSMGSVLYSMITAGISFSVFSDFMSLQNTAHMAAVHRYSSNGEGGSLVGQILGSFIYISPICCGYSYIFAKEKKEKLICFSSILPSIFSMLLTSAKLSLIAFVMLFFIGFYVAYIFNKKNVPKLKTKILVFLFGSALALYALFFLSFVLRIGSGEQNISKVISTKLMIYAFGHIQGFDIWFAENAFKLEDYGIFKNTFLAIKVLHKEKPDLIISSGAAVAVPFFYLGKLRGAKTVYIEVFDRIDKSTLTGKLVYPVTDKFIVQWEEMKKVYPKAINLGSIF